jgi:hypothetical protein
MKQEKAEQLRLLSLCSEKEERRFLLSCPSLWLHPVCCYKSPLKEEEGLLLSAFGALPWAFWCENLLEGKRVVEGNKEQLLKGKILKRDLKKVCTENFNIGFRKQS